MFKLAVFLLLFSTTTVDLFAFNKLDFRILQFEIEGSWLFFVEHIFEDVGTVGDDTVDTHFDEPLHVIF